MGNLPGVDGITDNLMNISSLSSMTGALGMHIIELKSLFHAVGLHPDASEHGSILPRKLGQFSLPSLVSGDNPTPPRHLYNFNLVLHYTASRLQLDNAHTKLPESPFLTAVSEICRSLLLYSSLRCGDSVNITPFGAISISTLSKFWENEDALWKLLFCMGALNVTNPEEALEIKPDPTWTAEICSTFAETQVCPAPIGTILTLRLIHLSCSTNTLLF